MRIFGLVLVTTFALMPTASLAADTDTEKATQEIRQRAAEFSAAWKKGDAKLVASFYATDGDMVTGAGHAYIGRDEIEQVLTGAFQDSLKDSTFSWTVEKVKLVKPDVAIADYDGEIKGAGNTGDPMKFHIVSVLVKQGGRWLNQTSRGIVYAQQ